MPADIFNISGDGQGFQRIDRAYVNTGGRGSFDLLTDSLPLRNSIDDSPGVVSDPTVTGISTKYDTKWDDPRYYQGDAIT